MRAISTIRADKARTVQAEDMYLPENWWPWTISENTEEAISESTQVKELHEKLNF